MIRNRFPYLVLTVLAAYGALGCESGGVGDPCIPEDEYNQDFNGFALSEVNVESRSFQCETRVCIVNHFQGRVSCPYGQEDPATTTLDPIDRARCRVPGTRGDLCVHATEGTTTASSPEGVCVNPADRNIDEIRVPVEPQLVFRATADSVYCSCRCAGPDPAAVYCECPSGFVCEELVRDVGVEGRGQLIGSYCIKPGTKYDPTHPPDPQACLLADGNDPNKTLRSADNKSRKPSEICGRTSGDNPVASNPPL